MEKFNIYYDHGDDADFDLEFENEKEAIKYALDKAGISIEKVLC